MQNKLKNRTKYNKILKLSDKEIDDKIKEYYMFKYHLLNPLLLL